MTASTWRLQNDAFKSLNELNNRERLFFQSKLAFLIFDILSLIQSLNKKLQRPQKRTTTTTTTNNKDPLVVYIQNDKSKS